MNDAVRAIEMARGLKETLRMDSLAMKAYICFQVANPRQRLILTLLHTIIRKV
jgi:hypothetical protein